MRESPVEQEVAKAKRQLLEQAYGAVKTRSRGPAMGIEVAAAVYLDLQRMDGRTGRAVALDNVPAGEGLIDACPKPH